jgi:hypothetical protein
MWDLYPDNRDDIKELATRVREIGGQWGIEGKIKIIASRAPSSANATDIVIAAGDMDKVMALTTALNALKSAQQTEPQVNEEPEEEVYEENEVELDEELADIDC